MIFAIDPGPQRSAYVVLRITPGPGYCIDRHGILENEVMLHEIAALRDDGIESQVPVVVEWIVGYGLTVGKETFETCRWVGRFEQAAGHAYRMTRKTVKQHLCSTLQAHDSHIRQALIDKVGPIGTKKQPGTTYGLKGDEWSALAVAVVFGEHGPDASV